MEKNEKIVILVILIILSVVAVSGCIGSSEENNSVEMINGGSSYFWHPENSEFELWQYVTPSDSKYEYKKLILEFSFYDSTNNLIGSKNITLENVDLHKSIYVITNLSEEPKTWDFKVIESIPI